MWPGFLGSAFGVLVGALPVLFFVALFGLLLVTDAVAEDSPETPPAPEAPAATPPAAEPEVDLFQRLIEGTSDGEWRGVLNRIRKERDAVWIGQELGTLFRDRVRFRDRVDVVAFTAAYLADHPESDKILLAEQIIRRAFGDPAFLDQLRHHITVGEGGWPRLLDHARSLLAAPDARTRALGAWFLSHEDGDQRERVRVDLLERARADLPSLERSDASMRKLTAAYLDAFDILLRYRFDSVSQAVETLTQLSSLDFAALVGELSRKKDLPSSRSPLGRTLVEYGKRLVDVAVRDGKLAAVGEFLDPGQTPMVAVRRYAILKAPALSPAATAEWAGLLDRVFRLEGDVEVLGRALDILEQVGFAETPDHALVLSTTLSHRLTTQGPDDVVAEDREEDRVRMAKAVGGLRMRTAELQVLLDRPEDLELSVLAALVRALGRMDGASAAEILKFFQAERGGGERERQIRLAAVDALGRPGVGADADSARVAASALREMLMGEGGAGLGRIEDPLVRKHALRSLGSYPGEATADVLRRMALEGDEAEAKVAIVVLGKAASKDAHAVGALAGTAIAEAATTPIRVEALKALAGLATAADPDAIERARRTARAVLGAGSEDVLREEAARTAGALADPAALGAVATLWGEASDSEARRDAFARLTDVLADRGDATDPAIVSAILGLDGQVPWVGLDAISAALLARHPRNGFRALRAKLLSRRARAEGVSEAEAIAAWEEADGLLEAILGPEPQDDKTGALALRVEGLQALGTASQDPAIRKGHWLEAVRLAARSLDAQVAARGREVVDALGEASVDKTLTPEERRRLAEDRKAIEKVLRGT